MFPFNREAFPEFIALREEEEKNAQGVVTGFHLGEVVDLLKTRVSVFARLLVTVCVSLRNAFSLGLIISKAMTTAWVTRKTPVNRSQQCFSPLLELDTHIMFQSHWCRLSPISVCKSCWEHWKMLFCRLLPCYFSLLQVNMQRKAIFQLILEKRELLESRRFRRDGTSYVIMSGMKPVIEIHSKHLTSKDCKNDQWLWMHYSNHRLLFEGNWIKP